jgi:hypothetical protein
VSSRIVAPPIRWSAISDGADGLLFGASDLSSPMSSLTLLEALEGPVTVRVVGGPVLPASPDDLAPCPCEDALGVLVCLAVGA